MGVWNFLARSVPAIADAFDRFRPSSSRRPKNMVSEQVVSRLRCSQPPSVGIPCSAVSTKSAKGQEPESAQVAALVL